MKLSVAIYEISLYYANDETEVSCMVLMRFLTLTVVVASFTLSACGILTRKPWRTYDTMPFESQKWRDGDEIERGRMLRDMRIKIVGKTRAEVIEMLGEPDEKLTQSGTESWLYNTEHPGRKSYHQTGVEFDKNGKARISMFSKDGLVPGDK